MKGSWWPGIIMLYFILLLCAGIAEGNNQFSSANMAYLDVLKSPIITDPGSLSAVEFLGGAATFALGVGRFILAMFPILFLYSPTLYSGAWLWFYFLLPLPIALGTIISLVMSKSR